MPVDNQSSGLKPAILYIPWQSMGGYGVTPAVTAGTGSEAFAAGALLPGAAANAPLLKEISTFGIVAPLMTTDGAEVCGFTKLPPYLFDPRQPLYFKVHYTTGSSTTADTIDWKVFVDLKAAETAALIQATTALDTTIAQDTVTGAYYSQFTAKGKKNAGWATRAQLEAGLIMLFTVEKDADAAGLTEDIFLLGLEIMGTPGRADEERPALQDYVVANGL